MNPTNQNPIVASMRDTLSSPQREQVRSTRVTLLTKLYHEVLGEDTVRAPATHYIELLETVENAYQRTLKIGIEWQEIDWGWTKDMGCSFLQLTNSYKSGRTVEPLPEEREDDLRHVLEIGKYIKELNHVEPCFVLYMNQPIVLSPMMQDNYRIRCRMPDGRYTVFAIPNDPE